MKRMADDRGSNRQGSGLHLRGSRSTLANKERRLTPLESIALGIVWKLGGCTSYEIMSEFSGSLTAQIKSRAGSVYPMMKRLHQEKLVSQKKTKRGQQAKVVYSITASGKNALVSWLTPPLENAEIGLSPDPVRSRVYFLGILPKAKRQEFVDEVLGQLKTELVAVRESFDAYEAANNEFGALAMKGAVYVARARIRWLKEIRKQI